MGTDLQHAQEVGQHQCSQWTGCRGAPRCPMRLPDWMWAAPQTWATLSNRSVSAWSGTKEQYISQQRILYIYIYFKSLLSSGIKKYICLSLAYVVLANKMLSKSLPPSLKMLNISSCGSSRSGRTSPVIKLYTLVIRNYYETFIVL